MEDYDTASSSYVVYWKDWFLAARGHEYFCEVDEEYLVDRFNLTGLQSEVTYYNHALDLVTDVFDVDCKDEVREQIDKSARHLYGLVHARYIITSRGLSKMCDKYKRGDFGRCPRVLCHFQCLLPVGLADVAGQFPVKLFCPKCEDIYTPKSSRHSTIDGAYFGTSFPHILFQVYPQLVPDKTEERFVQKCFGFKVHSSAALARWQEIKKEEMLARLRRQEGADEAGGGGSAEGPAQNKGGAEEFKFGPRGKGKIRPRELK